MLLSPVSVTSLGTIIIRRNDDFDGLVEDARNAGLDVHPCINARNWIVRPQPSLHITAVSVMLSGRAAVEDARESLEASGFRPCTPHEALCIALDRTDLLKSSGEYHVALDRIWNAPDGDAAIAMFDFVGQLHVGTSPCVGTWPSDDWRFLAAATR